LSRFRLPIVEALQQGILPDGRTQHPRQAAGEDRKPHPWYIGRINATQPCPEPGPAPGFFCAFTLHPDGRTTVDQIEAMLKHLREEREAISRVIDTLEELQAWRRDGGGQPPRWLKEARQRANSNQKRKAPRRHSNPALR